MSQTEFTLSRAASSPSLPFTSAGGHRAVTRASRQPTWGRHPHRLWRLRRHHSNDEARRWSFWAERWQSEKMTPEILTIISLRTDRRKRNVERHKMAVGKSYCCVVSVAAAAAAAAAVGPTDAAVVAVRVAVVADDSSAWRNCSWLTPRRRERPVRRSRTGRQRSWRRSTCPTLLVLDRTCRRPRSRPTRCRPIVSDCSGHSLPWRPPRRWADCRAKTVDCCFRCSTSRSRWRSLPPSCVAWYVDDADGPRLRWQPLIRWPAMEPGRRDQRSEAALSTYPSTKRCSASILRRVVELADRSRISTCRRPVTYSSSDRTHCRASRWNWSHFRIVGRRTQTDSGTRTRRPTSAFRRSVYAGRRRTTPRSDTENFGTDRSPFQTPATSRTIVHERSTADRWSYSGRCTGSRRPGSDMSSRSDMAMRRTRRHHLDTSCRHIQSDIGSGNRWFHRCIRRCWDTGLAAQSSVFVWQTKPVYPAGQTQRKRFTSSMHRPPA